MLLAYLRLSELTSSDEETEQVLNELCCSQITSLTDLAMDHNSNWFVNPEYFGMALDFMVRQSNLQRLWLHDNNLSSENIERLLDAFINSQLISSIKNLWIGGNSFDSQTAWDLLAQFIDRAESLDYLDISGQTGTIVIKVEFLTSKTSPVVEESVMGHVIIRNKESGTEIYRLQTSRVKEINIGH